MKQESKGKVENEISMELKYCERCGCLWLRQCGAGVSYCQRCEPEVRNLPAPKKLPTSVRLPRARAVVGDYEFAMDDDDGQDRMPGGAA